MTSGTLQKLILAFLTFLVLSSPLAQAETSRSTDTLAGILLKEYREIKSITCEIRKTTVTEETVRMLSRVYYSNPLRVHVDNISPVKRTIVSDGKTLYYYEQGQPKGFSRPVKELTGLWLNAVNNIPATPAEHLILLENLPEKTLEADRNFPVRKAYPAEKVYVVLCMDTLNRLAKIEFYKSDEMRQKTAEYNYSEFYKVSDDCWIPQLHKSVMYMPDGETISETRIIDNLEVNKPIPESLFQANLFFENVEFVDDFDKTYQ